MAQASEEKISGRVTMEAEAALKYINKQLEMWKGRVNNPDTMPGGRTILMTHIAQMLNVKAVLTDEKQPTAYMYIRDM